MSEDPIGFDGGDSNFYRYVTNNPLLYTDPSGRSATRVMIAVVVCGLFFTKFILIPEITEWKLQIEKEKLCISKGGVWVKGKCNCKKSKDQSCTDVDNTD